jgi:hypothetical protein
VKSRVFRKRDDGEELREVSTDRGKGGSDIRFLSDKVSMTRTGRSLQSALEKLDELRRRGLSEKKDERKREQLVATWDRGSSQS